MSLLALHCAGQHVSPAGLLQVVIGVYTHFTLHSTALPVS
jgi:hypothetical protein